MDPKVLVAFLTNEPDSEGMLEVDGVRLKFDETMVAEGEYIAGLTIDILDKALNEEDQRRLDEYLRNEDFAIFFEYQICMSIRIMMIGAEQGKREKPDSGRIDELMRIISKLPHMKRRMEESFNKFWEWAKSQPPSNEEPLPYNRKR